MLGRLPAARGDRARISASTIAPHTGTASPTRSCADMLEQAWNREARRLHGGVRLATISTPACCCCPSSALSRPTIRASSRPSTRSSANLLREQSRHALRQRRRFRPAGDRVPDLPLLADRCAGGRSGRKEEARDLFVDALKLRNRYGLLSEDIHPQTGELWGNFPQTYSMAGLILTAMRLSRSWEDRYWRGSS